MKILPGDLVIQNCDGFALFEAPWDNRYRSALHVHSLRNPALVIFRNNRYFWQQFTSKQRDELTVLVDGGLFYIDVQHVKKVEAR